MTPAREHTDIRDHQHPVRPGRESDRRQGTGEPDLPRPRDEHHRVQCHRSRHVRAGSDHDDARDGQAHREGLQPGRGMLDNLCRSKSKSRGSVSQLQLIAAKRVLAEEFSKVLKDLNPDQLKEFRGWKLVIDTRPKGRLGQCRWSKKEIGISSWLLELNDPRHTEVSDTLRHEVAHVLAGPKAHHGARWRRFAMALGAKPTACCNTTRTGLVTPKSKSKILGTCGNCGKKFGRLRRPRRFLCCTECSTKLMAQGCSRTEAFSKSRISWLGA